MPAIPTPHSRTGCVPRHLRCAPLSITRPQRNRALPLYGSPSPGTASCPSYDLCTQPSLKPEALCVLHATDPPCPASRAAAPTAWNPRPSASCAPPSRSQLPFLSQHILQITRLLPGAMIVGIRNWFNILRSGASRHGHELKVLL